MPRVVLALVALLSVCWSVVAYATEPRRAAATETITDEQLEATGELDASAALSLHRPDLFSRVDGSVLIHSLPVLTLLDGRRFPIASDLGRMGMTPLDMFPVAFLRAAEVQKISSSPMHGSDGPGGQVDLRLNRIRSGGEVGFFYGKSEGKYGREDFQAYIIGGVGNDKVQITAGAAYHESSGHVRRPVRERQ